MFVEPLVEETHPSLPQGDRERVGAELQDVLVELIDLSLIGKQVHWSVEGPNFRALHEQLDELVAAWRELADAVAERAVALGVAPDGQAERVATTTPIARVPVGPLQDDVVVEGLGARLDGVIERARASMSVVAEQDPVSEDLLIDTVGTLEKQRWMIRAQRRR